MTRGILALIAVFALAGPAKGKASKANAEALVEAEIMRVLGPSLELKEVDIPARVKLASDARVRVRWDRSPTAGKRWVTVIYEKKGVEEATLARVELAERKAVVVLRRPVSAGSIIKADDLKAGFRAEDEALELLPSALVGATARIALQPGHVIRGGDIDLPPPVARGTVVSVRVRAPGFVVSTTGRLEQTARPGEQVAVRVEATKRVLQGRLVNPGEVSVEGGGE